MQLSGSLLILSYFKYYDDPRPDRIAGHLLSEQMPDGGRNCRRPKGATHASLLTAISALGGLRHCELHRGKNTRP